MIHVCGEALIDMLPGKTESGNDSFVPHTGGSPFNTCIAAARLGVETGFLGRISTDFFGQMLFQELKRNNVDLSSAQRGSEPTTLGFVKVEQGKDPEYAFYTEGTADCSLNEKEFPAVLPDSVNALVFGSISLLMEPGGSVIAALAEREHGRRVLSFDPNIRPVLIKDSGAFRGRCEHLFSLSTIVKVSDVDLQWLYPRLSLEKAAEKIKQFGPFIVAVTKGADGSFVLKDSIRVEARAGKINVADTVGAGDTFHAGFLAWLEKNSLLNIHSLQEITQEDLAQALGFASRCADITCSRQGADPPYADEVK